MDIWSNYLVYGKSGNKMHAVWLGCMRCKVQLRFDVGSYCASRPINSCQLITTFNRDLAWNICQPSPDTVAVDSPLTCKQLFEVLLWACRTHCACVLIRSSTRGRQTFLFLSSQKRDRRNGR